MALKMKPEPKRLLMEALVSGEYKQGTQYLKKMDNSGEVRHCCLGVACELAVKAGIIPEPVKTLSPTYDVDVWKFGESDDATSMHLPDKVVEWLFEPIDSIEADKQLDPAVGDFEQHVFIKANMAEGEVHAQSLTQLNDNGWSFKKIRDFIEKHF